MSTGTLFGSMLGLQYLRKCLKLSKRSISACELIVREHYIFFSCLIKKKLLPLMTVSSLAVLYQLSSGTQMYTYVHTFLHVKVHTALVRQSQFSLPASAFPHLSSVYFLSPTSESLVESFSIFPHPTLFL